MDPIKHLRPFRETVNADLENNPDLRELLLDEAVISIAPGELRPDKNVPYEGADGTGAFQQLRANFNDELARRLTALDRGEYLTPETIRERIQEKFRLHRASAQPGSLS